MSRVIPVQIEATDAQGAPAPRTVYFEVADVDVEGRSEGWRDVSAGRKVQAEEAGESLSGALETVKPLATRIVEGLQAMGEGARPKEVEVTLGVKLSGKVGFFVAESQGEASISLKLKWTL